MFVNLHNHSDYSHMDGFSKIPDMVKRTKELGQTALALTDHGTVSGLLSFYIECKKQGIKPILGCEFYITDNLNIKDRKNTAHLIVLAKNNVGYKNLLKLNTYAHEHTYYDPRIDYDILEKHKDGLIVTSACMGGMLKFEEGEQYVRRLAEIFGDDFYLEIHTNSLEQQKIYNHRVIDAAINFDISLVAAIDSHYPLKEDAYYHRKWKNISGDSEYYTTDDYYMMDEQDVRKRLAYYPASIVDESILNTALIADMCNVTIQFGGQNYPEFHVDDQLEELKKICRKGWDKVDGSQVYIDNILNEFNVLEKANYINYFLITHDIIDFCHKNNIRTGAGRGSIVGSLAAYLMGLTHIDPIKYGLIFERFCHLERVTAADIDSDVQTSRRGDVIQYIKDKYGDNRVFQIRTVNRMGAKGALKRAGQSMKIGTKAFNQEINRLSSLIKDSIDDLPKKYDGNILFPNEYDELKILAKKFQGIIQNFGVHASGIIVFPDEPENWCSLEKATESSGGNMVTSFEFHNDSKSDLESMGILKLDILGLNTLDVIQGALDSIDKDIDIFAIEDYDEKTFSMLQKGLTKGCFQIESEGMTDIIKQMQPYCIDDLVHLVALYRPGPKEAGMIDAFINGRGGLTTSPLHPNLNPILNETYGVILYQEQVMKIVQVMANYTLGQADVFRRAIGRKDEKLMQEILPPFIEACKINGYTDADAKVVADYIHGCSDYLFNKSHSAAYGYTAYQTAWLKANYPLEFMCALLNSEIGNKEKTAEYVEECGKMGIKILPPNIIKSTSFWAIESNCLRVGFKAISGIGKTNIESDTDSFHKFMLKYPKMNKKVVEGLVKAGCFYGDRCEHLARLMWYKEEFPKLQKYITNYHKNKDKIKNVNLLADIQPEKHLLADLEREVMGFTFHEKIDKYDSELVDGVRVFIGEVINVKPWKTKKGKDMAFVKFRFKSDSKDLVIFNDNYKKLSVGGIYLIRLDDNKILDLMEAKIKAG